MIAFGVEAAGDVGAPAVNVQMWAVQATQEDRVEPHFDRDVVAIKPAVKDLPYDTYKRVAVEWRAATVGTTAALPINPVYTLLATPLPDQADLRIRLDICVEMRRDPDANGGGIKALQTTMALVPGKMVNLRGFRLKTGGELLIVLMAER